MTKQTSEMITLTKDQISIFGRPNFSCREVAHVLIKSGVYKDGGAKSEYEQAIYIHWASNLLDMYGENWRNVGEKILKGLCEKLQAEKSDEQ